MKIFVTGAAGHLGRLVVDQLLAVAEVTAGVHKHRLSGVRSVAIDYQQPASLQQAFSGQDVVVYIPSKTYDVQARFAEFDNVLAAAKTAAVPNMVFVSFYANQADSPFVMAPFYHEAPKRLAASGLQHAVVTNALYADPLVPYLPELIQRQHLIYPIGDAAMSFITQADSAKAIATVAATPRLRDHGQQYTLTQNASLTMPELGAVMTAATGHAIGYAPVSNAEFAAIYAAEGDGQELASMYAGAALGQFDVVTADFETITGHQPQNMADFLKQAVKA